MNKIPIKDLLNPSSKNRYFKNELKLINSKLITICSKLPNSILESEKKVRIELDNIIMKLKLIKLEGRLDKEERYLIKMSYQLATVVANFLNGIKDSTIFNTLRKSDNKLITSNNDSDVVFNVVTQKMMNTDNIKQNSYRGHRFSKQSLEVLEEWYHIHRNKPYLDKNSTEFLLKETRLSRTQIKNWVSNKRRKEKTVQVSPEILQLIKGK